MLTVRTLVSWAAALAVVAGLAAPASAQPPKGKGKTTEEAVAAAVAYLKGTQADDGTWSKTANVGVTGVVVTGLLKGGKVPADDPMMAKALKFIESLADAETGSLAAGEQVFQKNYITAVNLTALKASKQAKYDPLVAKAAAYLKNIQTGATDGKKEDDQNFGGFGYGPGFRGDMSNTGFALDALTLVGTPADDPVFKRAVVFVSRMQNLKSEFNTMPWAGRVNDGSFFYVAPQPGGTKGDPDAPIPGYGSMTASGIKCYIRAGVGKDDPRLKKATEWLAKNYSVDVNPGRLAGNGGQGYYYYLLTLAKCLDAVGAPEFVDAAGVKHDWRAEITRALVGRQKRDGSWANDFTNWMETDANLCTGYALQTLAVCQAPPK
ncbi:MAG: prenyltransferase/squalene oxidase repeat-containing protein [Gemmataceae bacterium]